MLIDVNKQSSTNKQVDPPQQKKDRGSKLKYKPTNLTIPKLNTSELKQDGDSPFFKFVSSKENLPLSPLVSSPKTIKPQSSSSVQSVSHPLLLQSIEIAKNVSYASLKGMPLNNLSEQAELFLKNFQQVLASEKGNFISQVLKNFKQYQDLEGANFIFKCLSKAFPNLGEYFEFVPKGRIFKPKSIQILVDYLKRTKEMNSNFNCFVCEDCQSFEAQLQQLVNAPINSRYGFIVRCQTESNRTTEHVTAIYLEKTKDGWKALHLDAAGHSSAHEPILYLTTVLKQVKVYGGGEKRQNNGISCAIFALYDLAKISHRTNIFEELEKQIESSSINQPYIVLTSDQLPLDLLKIIQHGPRLKFYIIRKKKRQSNLDQEVNEMIKSITKYIVKSKNDNSELNDLARRLHLKYERIVLKELMKNKEGGECVE